ncbi:Helicase ATP-binding domain-containing protein [Aphelenchoides fujianensis]|nr:Helicase ATP-binding domain-containing protein [Aphelenchoides fujianensis]
MFFASSSFASKAADSAGDEPQSASRSAFRREPKYAGAVQDLGHQKAAYHRHLRSAPPPQQQRQKWRTSGDVRFGTPGDRADSFGGGRPSSQRTAGGFGGDQRQPAQTFGARLSPVDWEAAELPPIQKTIYAEDARVAARSPAEIDEWKAKHAVTLKGNNLPRPVLAFDEAGFPKEIQERLVAHYKQPTVIQSISWPVALSGHDMISIARTGSGKTLGFILPAILHTLAQPRRQPGGGPSVLVILPTRELAQQVQQVARDFCQPMGLTTTRTSCGAASTFASRRPAV